MERRSFIKHTGLAGILAAGSAPAFAQGAPGDQVALRVELPEVARTIDGASEVDVEKRGGATGGKFDVQVFAAGEVVRPSGRGRGPERYRSMRPHGELLLCRQGPTFAFGTRSRSASSASVRCVVVFGGGEKVMNEFYKEIQHSRRSCAATPARRWAAGTARKSSPSPISRASRCASAALPARCWPSSA